MHGEVTAPNRLRGEPLPEKEKYPVGDGQPVVRGKMKGTLGDPIAEDDDDGEEVVEGDEE